MQKSKKKRGYVKDEAAGATTNPYGSEEEMKARAGGGYFVRDPERNLMYCLAGEVLRQKSIKKNGDIRYANKTACRHCRNRNKCYKGKNGWKEIDFNKDALEKPCKDWLEAEGKEAEPEQRMSISEHPFGSIKRWMDAGYYLLHGNRKVDGETALMCLGYNLTRAVNLLGFEKMMETMA